MAATNTIPSQLDVNWSALSTRTMSWKKGDRKYATMVIAAVIIRRVKMTQPKSPLQIGAMKLRADSRIGLRGPRGTRIMPSPRDATRAGTIVRTVTAPMTAYAPQGAHPEQGRCGPG